jgi:hypothetical protein
MSRVLASAEHRLRSIMDAAGPEVREQLRAIFASDPISRVQAVAHLGLLSPEDAIAVEVESRGFSVQGLKEVMPENSTNLDLLNAILASEGIRGVVGGDGSVRGEQVKAYDFDNTRDMVGMQRDEPQDDETPHSAEFPEQGTNGADSHDRFARSRYGGQTEAERDMRTETLRQQAEASLDRLGKMDPTDLEDEIPVAGEWRP